MIRVLFIAVNFLVVLIVNLADDKPGAMVKAPSEVEAGKPFTVQVTINPNGTSGFLRYSMDMPNGWTAEKTDAAGADFFFEKNPANDKFAAKFLWSNIDPAKEIKITFSITPKTDASGHYELESRITRTVDNQPENIPVELLRVTVAGTNVYTPGANKDTTAAPYVHVTVKRLVPAEPVAGEFLVDLFIDKDGLASFGKIEDTLPAGCSAKVILTDGSDFAFENGVARFYWYVLPSRAQLHVQYKVTVSPAVSGPMKIYGHFSYIENETGKIARIAPSHFTVKENLVLQNDKPDQGKIAQSNDSSKEAKKPLVMQPVKDTKLDSPVAMFKAQKQNGVQVKYSVQIAAMRRMLPVTFFGKSFSIADPIHLEQIQGLNKYTTGAFSSYADARNHRESLKGKGIAGPFVTAYNSGIRITVQEALMITTQKWIP